MMNSQVKALLLSLLNATLMLGVILTLSAVFLVHQIEGFAEDFMTHAGSALLQEAGHEVNGAIVALKTADRDLKRLTQSVQAIIDKPVGHLSRQDVELLQGFRSDLEATNQLLFRMTNSFGGLSDQTVRRLGETLIEAIVRVGNCRKIGSSG